MCWTLLFCTERYSSVLNITFMCWTLLFCTEHYFYVLDITLLYWTLLICTEHYFYVLDITLLYWTLLLCTEHYFYVLDITHLYWTLLLCAGHYVTIKIITIIRMTKHWTMCQYNVILCMFIILQVITTTNNIVSLASMLHLHIDICLHIIMVHMCTLLLPYHLAWKPHLHHC